jgi:hypothetical protein
MHRAFRDHGDVPAHRTYVWNVVGVAVAAGAVYGAARVGHLAVFLAIVAGLVAAAGVSIVEIERRISGGPSRAAVPDEVAEEHRRVAASIAARRLREEVAR